MGGKGGNPSGECGWGQEGGEQQQSPAGCTLCLWYPQGSSKLEKAEVLQMTVDHLKMLHASGGTGTVLLTHYMYFDRGHKDQRVSSD